MTDLELLELAAKAAGIELFYDIFYDEEPCYYEKEIDCNIVWNPLTEDGDALRLAVKLGLQMYFFLPNDDIGVAYTEVSRWSKERHDSDPYAATRRAIVRAAANIGKSL